MNVRKTYVMEQGRGIIPWVPDFEEVLIFGRNIKLSFNRNIKIVGFQVFTFLRDTEKVSKELKVWCKVKETIKV